MKKKNLFLKSTSTLLAMLFMVMSSFMFTACNNDDDEDDVDSDPEPATSSILEIVSNSDSHTQLASFVSEDDDLAAALGGNDLTLFAPNDAAFATLTATLGVESLDQVRPDVIAAVLRYHAVTSVELRESFSETSELETVQGENITFNANSRVETGCSVRDVQFDGTEILATNGVVHVVETILIPPSICGNIINNLGRVSQTILLGAEFTTLAAAIEKADTYATSTEGVTPLSDILIAEDSTLTVFAPVNAVFASQSITLESFTAAEWYGLIANHVVASGTLLAEDLAVGDTYTSVAGGPITVLSLTAETNPAQGINTGVVLSSDGLGSANAQVASADLLSTNGVVHAIAGVLTPPTVMGAVKLNENFSTLDAAIEKADTYAEATDGVPTLFSILSDPARTLTVFAPINASFQAALITLDTYTAQEWYGIIANHALATTKLRADFVTGNANTTLADGAITLLPSGGLDSNGVSGGEAIFVDGSTDIAVRNGVVHAIAGVLAPAASGPTAIDKEFTFLKSLAK